MTGQHAAGDATGGMFAAIDRKDSEAFVGYLADDALFRFGSAPAVRGRDAIRVVVDAFFSSIAGSTHAIRQTLTNGTTRVCEGEVTYRRLDGTSVTLPFTDVFEYEGDRIAEYKIYIDIAPLYSDQA